MRTGAWKLTSITWATSAGVRRVTGMRAGMPALFTRQSTPSNSARPGARAPRRRRGHRGRPATRATRGCARGTRRAPPRADRRAGATSPTVAPACREHRSERGTDSRRCARDHDASSLSILMSAPPGSAVPVRRWAVLASTLRRRCRGLVGTPGCSSGDWRSTARTPRSRSCRPRRLRVRDRGHRRDVDGRPVDQPAPGAGGEHLGLGRRPRAVVGRGPRLLAHVERPQALPPGEDGGQEHLRHRDRAVDVVLGRVVADGVRRRSRGACRCGLRSCSASTSAARVTRSPSLRICGPKMAHEVLAGRRRQRSASPRSSPSRNRRRRQHGDRCEQQRRPGSRGHRAA